MPKICFTIILRVYFFLLAKGITELSFQMGTDHLFYEVDRPLPCIYATFLFHLRCIYVSHMSLKMKQICPLLPRFTQMRTDHQLQKFAQKSCYLAFKFYLCDIYVAFCFIYVSFMPLQLKQICPFCRTSPRWGPITSFINSFSCIYATFMWHLLCIYVAFMQYLCCIYTPEAETNEDWSPSSEICTKKSRYLAKHAPWQRSNLKNGRK